MTLITTSASLHRSRYNSLVLVSVVAASLYLAQAACAQVYSVTGSAANAHLGYRVTNVGDVDGDSFDDVAVPNYYFNGTNYCSQVKVLSGVSGSVLYTVSGSGSSIAFGISIARLPDVNGDSVPDLIIGSTGDSAGGTGGYVKIVSGANGNTISTINNPDSTLGNLFGQSVSAAGDVNGDGVQDYLVGAPGAATTSENSCGCTSCSGTVYVISGASGHSVLYAKHGGQSALSGLPTPYTSTEPYCFGESVASLGDVNGDGTPDFAGVTNTESGFYRVFSGASGGSLYTVQYGTTPYILSSTNNLNPIGDVTGDGKKDLVIGIPLNGAYNGGYVEVRSGADGSLVRRVNSVSSHALFGTCVDTSMDFDHDGVPDLVVGAPMNTSVSTSTYGYAMAVSGANGSQIFQVMSPRPGISFGCSVVLADQAVAGAYYVATAAPDDDVGYTDSGSLFANDGSTIAAPDEYYIIDDDIMINL